MPRGSPVTWMRTTWRGRTRPLHGACVLYMPLASSTCRVRPLHAACVPCTLDAHGLERTRVSPTPRTRAAWRGRACPLHHGHARPLYPGRVRRGGEGRPLYPDGRGLDKTGAVWRGRARCGKDARVSYTPRTSSPRRSGLLHGARVSLKSNLCPLHPVPVFYNLRPSYTPPIHRARRVEQSAAHVPAGASVQTSARDHRLLSTSVTRQVWAHYVPRLIID